MNWKWSAVLLLIGGIVVAPIRADEAPAPVSPGHYRASVAPEFNSAMAGRIQKQLEKIDGLDAVSANSNDSSISFTVKDHAHVDIVQIRQALNAADEDAVMTTPILANSLSANPGL